MELSPLYMSESCRICMSRRPDMISIFDDSSAQDREKTIHYKISYCSNVQMSQNDGLPNQMCFDCLSLLESAYKFKTSCEHSDAEFRKAILKCIKTDDTDNDDEKKVDTHLDVAVYSVKTECDDSADLCDEGLATLSGNDEADELEEKIKCEETEKEVKKRGRKKKEITKVTEIKEAKRPVGRPRKNLLLDVDKAPKQRSCRSYLAPGKVSKRLFCEKCNIKFETSVAAKKHRKTHIDDVSLICEFCGKNFQRYHSLYCHVKSHLPPEHKCDNCNYSTWHKGDLVKHLLTHSGVRPHHCAICSKTFVTAAAMRGHVRGVHNKERNFACHICPKRFFGKTDYERHIDAHNNIRRFSCDICGTAFIHLRHWKRHMLKQHQIKVKPPKPGRKKVNFVVQNGAGILEGKRYADTKSVASIETDKIDTGKIAVPADGD